MCLTFIYIIITAAPTSMKSVITAAILATFQIANAVVIIVTISFSHSTSKLHPFTTLSIIKDISAASFCKNKSGLCILCNSKLKLLNMNLWTLWKGYNKIEAGMWYNIKPNYFKNQSSSSSFLLTWSRYIDPKWPWSLSRLVPCLKWMELDCQVLLGHFGPLYLLQVSKNDDEERCIPPRTARISGLKS